MTLKKLHLFFFSLALTVSLLIPAFLMDTGISAEKITQVSDHFDGLRYFNPPIPQTSLNSDRQASRRSVSWWVWNWILKDDWPAWPEVKDMTTGARPVARVLKGVIGVTPVGHATFLIQIDGLNILTDPIWSDRCSPVSWAGPKRHVPPGIRFEDLPPIDVILVSHNHYDHLDLPTLERLAERGTPRSVVPLGNLDLVRSTGIPTVDELDWWQSVRISPDVTVTVVPAQHFSMRTLWNYNQTLWGGFVISGYSGNVFYSGDTGYGPHFREIARRFSPIRVALLPIAPFRPQKAKEPAPAYRSIVHMGPAEAVKAHQDLGAPLTIAAHYQVFRLGIEGFEDAAATLAATLKEHHLEPAAFIAPVLGQAISIPPMPDAWPSIVFEAIAPDRRFPAAAHP